MTPKKPRKSLNDSLASEFVYGLKQVDELDEEESQPAPQAPPASPSPLPVEKLNQKSLMSKLMEPEKEATTRVTVDLPRSMHRKLSILCARTGRKKVEVIRMLLDEALQEINE